MGKEGRYAAHSQRSGVVQHPTEGTSRYEHCPMSDGEAAKEDCLGQVLLMLATSFTLEESQNHSLFYSNSEF